MSITRSEVRNITRSTVRDVVRGGDSVVQRYITEMSAAGSMYDLFSSQVTLDDDFEWEVQYFGTAAESGYIIGSIEDDALCSIAAGGVLRVYAGAEDVDSTTAINDGKLWTIGGKRESTTLSVLVNSSVENTLTDAGVAGSITIDAIMRFVSAYADGVWLNLKIWTGGDRDTGTLIVDAAKDESGVSNIVGNNAATIGPELITDNTSTGWLPSRSGVISDVTGGIRATATVTGTQGAAYELAGLTIGEMYLVSFSTESNATSGSSFPRAATDSDFSAVIQPLSPSYDAGTSGRIESFFTAEAETMYVGLVRTLVVDGTYIDILNATVKHVPASTPLLTRVNQTTNEVALYQFDGGSSPNTWTDVDNDLNVIEIAGT